MFLAVPAALFVVLLGVFFYLYSQTKIPSAPPLAQTTYVYDRHGKVLTTLHSEVNRTEIPLSQMPLPLRQAVVAIEDKNFYHEGGVSFSGIARAALANLRHRQLEQGGSTITQQYVKLVYTGSQRTVSRKITEAIIAMKIDKQYSKDEILQRYLNTVYFGQGAYGVQAAAETYWGIPARQLSVVQSATLAGLIQAPSTYDPVHHPTEAVARRNVVLQDMATQGYISQSDAIDLSARPVKVRKNHPLAVNSAAPYFTDYVYQQLLSQYGKDETLGGGLKITTSLDLNMQRDAESAVYKYLNSPSQPAAALVAIDPRNGQIRAMVGGLPPKKRLVSNWAVDAHRQAGSSFKPFTLIATLEDRISLLSTWYGPPSITINNPKCDTNGAPWQPHNYADEAAGTMNLVSATAHSVNTIFAQLVAQVGPETRGRRGAPHGHHQHPPAGVLDRARIAVGDPPGDDRRVRNARRERRPSPGAADRPGEEPQRQPAVHGTVQAEGGAGAQPERRRAGHVRDAARRHGGHRDRGGARHPPRGRQDGNGRELRRRLVLRLHAPARRVRVDGLPEERDDRDAQHRRLRRHRGGLDPRGHLARVHGEGHGGDAGAGLPAS